MRILGISILAYLFVSPLGAALPPEVTEEATRLRDMTLGFRGGAEVVRSLTDEVGPRLSGSRGSTLAEEWALKTLRRVGLANVHAEPLLAPHWERGAEEAEVVLPFRQRLHLTALGGSPGTPPEGIEAPVLVTEDVASLAELLEKNPSAARGKIVFFKKKMERSREGSGYGKTVGIRSQGPREAAKAGAVAALIRSVGTSGNRLPHTGATDTGGSLVPAAALSAPDADLLERLSTAPLSVHLTLTCRSLPDAPARNIVGDVPGDGREFVLLGAHLDSWDLGQGAIDDGAGVGIVVEAARVIAQFAKHHPRRTVRVVLFANEENGTRGARGYAEAHSAELGNLVGALEMDFGTDRVYGFASLTGEEGEEPAAATFDLLRPIGVTERQSGRGGADISPLGTLGVPVFDLRQDGTHYFDIHHSADDTYDKIDPASLEQAVAAVVTFAVVASEMPGTFGRVPVTKRRSE